MKWNALVAGLAFGAAMLTAAADAHAQYSGPRAANANYAEDGGYGSPRQTYSAGDIVDRGHKFFGSTTRGLGGIVEKAVSTWGEPDAYILGEEGSGAFVGGLRYGEGKLFTQGGGDQGDRHVYWQGPSLGFDFGGDGARTMILVYNLTSPDMLYSRFAGINGSAYLVGGFGMTALKDYNVVLVPIRTGLGARLGVNVGYLKFTPQSTWNPF
ncbi:DUF1134 domain-containing protein [Chenggangzhangella methanolivorans]|uniref:DUF1134 domain-containing protein n=1 Tax=Chenggangzhangella methanolivorans TaxID=1437009 RepID=A0A9E6ULR2_9HYPH|nr:DUF1134 domain-containing protein [Chenggangzhangella methanolivorans]QZN99250.1 DUF1134 domain-containing protein [Chenggangzhangella methanolivorans]